MGVSESPGLFVTMYVCLLEEACAWAFLYSPQSNRTCAQAHCIGVLFHSFGPLARILSSIYKRIQNVFPFNFCVVIFFGLCF